MNKAESDFIHMGRTFLGILSLNFACQWVWLRSVLDEYTQSLSTPVHFYDAHTRPAFVFALLFTFVAADRLLRDLLRQQDDGEAWAPPHSADPENGATS